MPEREYFSYRYAIPGFTFLLLVILINHVPLLQILSDSAFGAFLAFLSLFTGSAIGFLVSQFWWLLYIWKGRIFGIKELRPAKHVLIKECKKHGANAKIEESKAPIEAILDYINHRGIENEISRYRKRRWDMYHVLSSTLLSLFIGLGVGIGLRMYYERYLFNNSLESMRQTLRSTLSSLEAFLNNPEAVAFLAILICWLILLIAFVMGIHEILTNYRPVLDAFILHEFEVAKAGEDLVKVFPEYFPSEAPTNAERKDGINHE